MTATASAKTTSKTAAPKAKAKAAPRTKAVPTFSARFKKVFSVKNLRVFTKTALACLLPLFAMACSLFTGHLYGAGAFFLAGLSGLLAVTILTVSTPHLAFSIGELSKSSKYQSYALAIAIDGGVLLSEGVISHASSEGVVQVAAIAMMVALVVMSALFNWFAFGNEGK